MKSFHRYLYSNQVMFFNMAYANFSNFLNKPLLSRHFLLPQGCWLIGGLTVLNGFQRGDGEWGGGGGVKPCLVTIFSGRLHLGKTRGI